MTALHGLRDAGKLQPEQKVLIIGAAGGVGTHAVQLAKAFGAVVTGVCSTSKAELVRAIGANEVIDYTREDFTDGPRRFNLILDTAGRRPLSQLRRVLTPQGILVIVGGEGGDRWLGGFQRQIFAPLRSRFTEQNLLGLISNERQVQKSKTCPSAASSVLSRRSSTPQPTTSAYPARSQCRRYGAEASVTGAYTSASRRTLDIIGSVRRWYA